MTTPVTAEQLAAWQAMVDEATPGDWQWYGNVRQKDVYLATVDRGRVFVMGFERWGMQGAQPRFQMRLDGTPGPGIMRGIEELDAANGPWMIAPHRNDFAGIGHPDARLIAAAPTIARGLLAEVERLTKKRDEAKATIGRQADRITWLTMQHRGHDWTPEIERLRAGIDQPAEEPDAEVLTAPHRCDCCSAIIEPGASAVMFTDEARRECWAHYGPCPAPDRWRVEYVDQSAGAGDLAVEGPLPLEDAYALAMSLHSHWWADRVRLVRCKESRR